MCKNVLKWRTFKLTAWITGKRLKIDGNMLRGVWQALNSLSIHVTFTAIVPGGVPRESKMWLKRSFDHEYCWKPVTRHRYTAISHKWLKIDGYAARHLTSIEFSFDPCNIYRDSPRGVGYSADARSVGDSHPSCRILFNCLVPMSCERYYCTGRCTTMAIYEATIRHEKSNLLPATHQLDLESLEVRRIRADLIFAYIRSDWH